jgi:very-short-patch-repair endonuclease
MSELEEVLAFQIRAVGLPEPTREHKFDATGRKWRFDFCWPEHMVAVEVEGAVWSNGRHTRGSGYTKDVEKYNAATLAGWRVYRATADMIESGEAITMVERALGRVPEHA